MAKTEVMVGRGLNEAMTDVAAAWKAAVHDEPLTPSDRIYVRDWETLYAVLTPDRYALLRHLRRSPARSLRDLAEALDRDGVGVDADVVALQDLGLLQRAYDGSLSSDVDEIASTIRIAA